MLSLTLMGGLALAILWVNTLLVVGAALTPLSELMSRLRRDVRRGEITAAVDGVLAAHVVDQVGRRASDDAARKAILFHDRGYASELFGGDIDLDGETWTLEAGAPVEVWSTSAEKRERAAAAANDDFEEAYRASGRAKGFSRQLTSELGVGQPVWVAQATDRHPLWLASFDARSWLRGRVALVLGFQLGMIALSGLVTALCLYPPVFGTVSTLGGVLGLIHFLLVMQPLGVTVREAARLPHQAVVRGSWIQRGSEGQGVGAGLGQQAI